MTLYGKRWAWKRGKKTFDLTSPFHSLVTAGAQEKVKGGQRSVF